jgi:putative tryptophan/tyrosine transport system substrate-binding protein
VKRREFITLLGGAAAAWPVAARAQQAAMPVVGFLSSGSRATYSHFVAGFVRGLNEIGYVEGRNVVIEYRWADGQYGLLPAMALDLVRRNVALIVASGGPPPALAAKAATSTIPIVFSSVNDPVELGLVASLNRPGSNATGMSLFRTELLTKQFELLRELAPRAGLMGIFVNPTSPNTDPYLAGIREVARALDQPIQVAKASTESEIDAAFATLTQQRASTLLVAADTLFNTRRDQLVALAARHGIPAIYQFREFTAAGGLISYGTDVVAVYRQLGVYAGRILSGVTPADLPVQQPTKFELAINLKTAKALGLEIPDKLLALADDVIE